MTEAWQGHLGIRSSPQLHSWPVNSEKIQIGLFQFFNPFQYSSKAKITTIHHRDFKAQRFFFPVEKKRGFSIPIAAAPPQFQEELVRAAAATAAVVTRAGGLLSSALRAASMSVGSSSVASGARTARSFEYGRTHVVRPKGRHLVTIVWLHGLGDTGASWSQLLETLPLPNIKWICPTAPTRPVAVFGGFPCTAWFDVGDLSEDGPDDIEGLDASAMHVSNLLSTEPADIKLGVGGFSMGAATALYSATCYAHGKYGNGNTYPLNLSAVVGLSGWLPCSRSLKNKIEGSQEAVRRAATLPLLLCHGRGDDVVLYKHGEKSAEVLKSTGFQNTTFKTYTGLGHYTVPEETDDVCNWLKSSLGLDGSSP